MKPMLPLIGLTILLSACGTGLIPPVDRDLDPIDISLPAASSAAPIVVYVNTNQFDKLSDIVSKVDTVEINGKLVYIGSGLTSTLTNVGVYIRGDLDGQGCYNDTIYLICSGDESKSKLQDIAINRGVEAPVKLAGAVLDKAVQNKKGYIGFRINEGNTSKGDRINITSVKATVRF
jgi:hypothetical protein